MKEMAELKSQNHKLRMEQQKRDQLQEKQMTNLEEGCGINYGNGKLGTHILKLNILKIIRILH